MFRLAQLFGAPLAMLAAILALVLGVLISHAGIIDQRSPRVVRKTMVGDAVAGISATATGTVVWDLRGRSRNLAVRVNVTAITGGLAATNFFKLELLGSHTELGPFTPIQGMISAEMIAIQGYQFPLSTVTEAVILPRFVIFRWTETGAITGFSAQAYIDYDDDPTGPGRQANHDYRGG